MTSIRKSVPDGTSRAFLSQVKMKGILDSLLSYWGYRWSLEENRKRVKNQIVTRRYLVGMNHKVKVLRASDYK